MNIRVAAEGLGAISGDVHKRSWPRHLEGRGPQDSTNPSPYQLCYGNSRRLPSTLGPPPSLLSESEPHTAPLALSSGILNLLFVVENPLVVPNSKSGIPVFVIPQC